MMHLPSRLLLAATPLFFAGVALSHLHAASPSVSHVWKGGAGRWEDLARWDGVPFQVHDSALIEGDGEVHFSQGDVTVHQLDVGVYHDAHSTFVMESGMLAVPHFIRLGEMTGTSGRLIQRGGDIRTVEIFVGVASVGDGKDRRGHGELEVRGGSIVTRHLTLGWGTGSQGRIHIVGSAAQPVLVLDYFWVGIHGPVDGSETELAYDLDAHGVTPIMVWNPKLSSIVLVDEASKSTCRLRLGLVEPPPGGDIALLRFPVACRGTFTDLPEGSPVRATVDGRTFEWTLTYHGGPKQTDVVLTQPRVISADGTAMPWAPGPVAKNFEVTAAQADAGLRDLVTRETAGETPVDVKAPRAFPGAEGFGAFAKGGRGGRALFVTNLNDAGPGSLREAIETKGPRTILFNVGGVIQLKSSLAIREPFVTIAGQTAPGEGICVRADSSLHCDTFVLSNTHDVVVRFVRAQNGKGPQPARYDDGGECISAYDSSDFIIDHCSTHFGTDETLSATGTVDRYTVQWTIIGEGLNYNKHSMASLLGGGRSTWHHNLFVHTGSRNPNMAGEPTCDFRNNVIYNWGFTSGQGGFTAVNYMGNYLRPGPSTRMNPLRFMANQSVALARSMHIAGNFMDGAPETTTNNALGADYDPAVFASAPFPMVPMSAEDSAETAFQRVLHGVGATLPQRDAADRRVIADVETRGGKIIDSQDEVGGFPAYAVAHCESKPDGIPVEWKTQHGLDPHKPLEAQAPPGSGYTWLEEYLNDLAAGGNPR